MTGMYHEGRALRHDLAERINWYLDDQRASEAVVLQFLDAYAETKDRLLLWPMSGRTVEGASSGLQEINFPRPFHHYVLLFKGSEERVIGYRLFHSAQERTLMLRQYQQNPDLLDDLM